MKLRSRSYAYKPRLCGFPPFVSCEEFSEQLGQMPYYAFFNYSSEFLADAIVNGKYSFPSPFWDEISPLGTYPHIPAFSIGPH